MSGLVSKPKFMKCFISHVMVSKKEIEIWCQTDASLGSRVESLLQSLHSQLSDTFALNSFELKPIPEPEVGKYFLTHMKNDLNFYRVVVTHVEPESGRALVSYIDFGNEDWIPFKQLVSMDLLFESPPLAQKFFLADIKPKDKEWDLNKVKRTLQPFLLSTFQCEVVRISKNTECIRVYDQFFNQPLVQKLLTDCGGIVAIDISPRDVMKGIDLTVESRNRCKDIKTNGLLMNGFTDKETIDLIPIRDRYMKSNKVIANEKTFNDIEDKENTENVLQMNTSFEDFRSKKPKLENGFHSKETTYEKKASVEESVQSKYISNDVKNEKKRNRIQFEESLVELNGKSSELETNVKVVSDLIPEERVVNSSEELKPNEEVLVKSELIAGDLREDNTLNNEMKTIETEDKVIESVGKCTENETKDLVNAQKVVDTEHKVIDSVQTEAKATEIEAKGTQMEALVDERDSKAIETEAEVVQTEAIAVQTQQIMTETQQIVAETQPIVAETDPIVAETELNSVETEAVVVESVSKDIEIESKTNESNELKGISGLKETKDSNVEKLVSTKNSIYVTAVHSDHTFHCQLSSKFDEISALTQDMSDFYNKVYKTEELDLNLAEVKANDMISARYSADELWYRALVKKVCKDQLEVVYVDFGNDETVGFRESKQLVEKFREMPAQARHCQLMGEKIAIEKLKEYESEMNEIDCEFSAITDNVYKIQIIKVKSV